MFFVFKLEISWSESSYFCKERN